MILRTIVKLCEWSPWFRRRAWHRWYQYLAGYPMEQWRFMNYGYVSLDDESWAPELEPSDEADRFCIQLYHYVVGEAQLAGKQVLEVGSGRGGGASFVSRYHRPEMMTALDYSQKVIEFCQQHRGTDTLRFVHGSAESLPFDNNSFDVVLNVESSHCYGSMPRFLTEVHRVLKPGGRFLWADFRAGDAIEDLDKQMKSSGMEIVERKDITANVLESMRQDNDRKLDLIHRWAGKRVQGTIRQFAGVEGSEINDGFRRGDLVYLSFRMRRPID